MDVLAKLFGTAARVKILRLFLLNPGDTFTVAEVSDRARITLDVARRETAIFTAIGLLNKGTERRKGKGIFTTFVLNDKFTHLIALRGLLTNAPVQGGEVRTRLRGAGAVKLIIIAGIFIGDFDGRIDMLIVGDRVNPVKFSKALRALESNVGKELRYALLSTSEFRYRLGLYDRLIRDVLDYPHQIVYDKLNVNLPS